MASVITITTQPPVDPETSTQTYYQQLAAEVMTAFETIVAILPKLEEAELADAKQARKHLNVPDALCATAINAIEQIPELEAATPFHAEKARNFLQFLEAFRPVDDKLDGLSRRLKHALRAIKSALASGSMQTYRIARAQASNHRNPVLDAHVDAMKRDFGRRAPTKAEREVRASERLKDAVAKELAKGGWELKKAA